MLEKPPIDRVAGEGGRERELGPPLIARLYGLIRALRLYDSSNEAVRNQVVELVEIVRQTTDEEATLLGMGDYCYLNGVRLRADRAHVGPFRGWLAELELRDLGGLRFLPGLAREELEGFLRLMVAARDAEKGGALVDEAAAAGIRHVIPIRSRDLVVPESGAGNETQQAAEGERERAKLAFARAIQGTRHVMIRTLQSGRPALQQARRVVQPLVDRLLKDEQSLVGLTALKQHDEYTFAHCVNVSVLSIRIGQVLGFPKQELANLGVAALLHDVGKVEIPHDVLHKPGALTAEEWAIIHRHPLAGLRVVSRAPGLSPLLVESMRVAFQHHMTVDGAGYPKVPGAAMPGPAARVIAVADFFDAVTSHRAYRARPMTPFEALSLMLGGERRKFDPAALWALLQATGLYPAGSLLETESGHVLLSLSPNPHDIRRPVCRVIGWPAGSEGPEGEIWSPIPASERVTRVLVPEETSVDVPGLLAA